ncbi:MAG: hypothetical protein ACLFUB_20035 [Cyclobacteriaceae bacterium]
MKKDIDFPKVEGVSMAITRQRNQQTDKYEFYVYLINDKNVPLENVLVNSTGYSKDQETRTSTLRHFIERVEPYTSYRVEPIMPDLFKLVNRYWLSYFIDGQLFDKKFTFMPESVTEQHFAFIESVQMEGVLHA